MFVRLNDSHNRYEHVIPYEISKLKSRNLLKKYKKLQADREELIRANKKIFKRQLSSKKASQRYCQQLVVDQLWALMFYPLHLRIDTNCSLKKIRSRREHMWYNCIVQT